MKILSVQPINLRIPFSDGSLGKGIMNSELSKLSPQKMTETSDFAHI